VLEGEGKNQDTAGGGDRQHPAENRRFARHPRLLRLPKGSQGER
jgi:hypothetical protein